MRRKLTEGSISKNILYLSIPTMIAFIFHSGFNIVDTIFIGRISPEAIAAISITFPIIFLMISLGVGVGIGTSSLIAQFIGAKKLKQAGRVAEHALILSIILALLFAFGGLLFGEQLFKLIGATEEVLPLALSYANIIFIGSFFMFVAFIANNILRGEGDMKTPMKMMAFASIINVILDPLLIFGIGPFPRMEVAGAALATVIARSLGSFWLIYYLFKGNSLIKIDFRNFSFDFGIIREIFRIGIPTSLSNISMSAAMAVLLKITSLFGAFAVAAYGIGFRLESFAFLPIIGISTAVITIVGQNVGAKNIARARKTALAGAGMASLVMGLFGLVLFLFPSISMRVFTNDMQVVSIGAVYLKYVALTFFFFGFSVVISAAFQGAGNAVPSLVIQILRLFVISIPLAYILSITLGFGVSGIWIAIALANVISALIGVAWFVFGKLEKKAISS